MSEIAPSSVFYLRRRNAQNSLSTYLSLLTQNNFMAKNHKVGKALGVAGAVAAVGAGAYYLLGPDGKKHQKGAKAMLTKAEKKVMDAAKKVDVKKIQKEYKGIMGDARKIERTAMKRAKSLKKTATHVARKVVKKTSKK